MITINFQNCIVLIFLCFLSLLCYHLFFKKPKDGFNLPQSHNYPGHLTRIYGPMFYGPFEYPEGGSIRGLQLPLEISLGFSMGNQKKTKNTCLRVLRLCRSSGIFTFSSLFYHTRLFRRSRQGTDLSSTSVYSKFPLSSPPRPPWHTISSGRTM